MNDEELVAGLVSGDLEAQVFLLDVYQARLVDHLLNRFPSLEGDIEEMVADAIYRIIIDPSLIDLSKGKIWSFLKTIAWRKAIDLFRKRQAVLKERQVMSLDTLNEELTADGATVTQWQDDRFHNQESREANPKYSAEVVKAVQQVIVDLNLSEEHLEHIRLRLVEKLQPKEIAALKGISPDSEGVRWHRLMRKINNEWGKHPVLVEYAGQHGIEVPQQ